MVEAGAEIGVQSHEPSRPQSDFITGSSSGLARAAAKLFASKGWNVIASMRDPKQTVSFVSLFSRLSTSVCSSCGVLLQVSIVEPQI
jgi:hypothetical protein